MSWVDNAKHQKYSYFVLLSFWFVGKKEAGIAGKSFQPLNATRPPRSRSAPLPGRKKKISLHKSGTLQPLWEFESTNTIMAIIADSVSL